MATDTQKPRPLGPLSKPVIQWDPKKDDIVSYYSHNGRQQHYFPDSVHKDDAGDTMVVVGYPGYAPKDNLSFLWASVSDEAVGLETKGRSRKQRVFSDDECDFDLEEVDEDLEEPYSDPEIPQDKTATTAVKKNVAKKAQQSSSSSSSHQTPTPSRSKKSDADSIRVIDWSPKEKLLQNFSPEGWSDPSALFMDGSQTMDRPVWTEQVKPIRTNPFAPEAPVGPIKDTRELRGEAKKKEVKPIDIFMKYYGETFDYMWKMTNVNMQERRVNGKLSETAAKLLPQVISKELLAKHIGLQMIMGCYQISNTHEFWEVSEYASFPIFGQTMSRDLFSAITSVLHGCNEDDRKEGDPISKIRPMLDIFRKTLLNGKHYQPGRDVALDEQMLRWTGNLMFKHVRQAKPCADGIKIWAICEAGTGFLISFYVDLKDKVTIREKVLAVADDLPGKGFHIYMDNLFTCPYTFALLHDMGQYACGTVRSNKELPEDLVSMSASQKSSSSKKKALKGQYHTRYTDSPAPMICTQWMDSGPCLFLSSCHQDTKSSVKRKTVGEKERQTVPCPQAAADYNVYMNAVDQFDNLRSRTTVLRRSKKWYLSMMSWIIDSALINGMITYRQMCPDDASISHKDFQKSVASALIGDSTNLFKKAPKRKQPAKSATRKVGRPSTQPVYKKAKLNTSDGLKKYSAHIDGDDHFPELKEGRHPCVWCRSKGEARKLTRYVCAKCSKNELVYLHPECSGLFHSHVRKVKSEK